MPHAFPADLGLGDLHAATVANDILVFDALVFSAGAFPILGGSKNFLAE